MTRAMKSRIQNTLFYIILGVILVWTLFPFFWMVTTAFKVKADYFAFPPVWIPSPFTGENFHMVLFGGGYMGGEAGGVSISAVGPLVNTVIIGFSTTIISVALASLAAFALSRFDFRGKQNIAFWILSLRVLPPIAIILPYFLLMKTYRLIDTHLALIITYLVFNLPFAVWLLMRYFEDIPRDLEDAALVDGCSRMAAFWRVLLPITTPGIIAVAIFCLINAWNEFMFANILTRYRATTIPVVLSTFIMHKGVAWGPMAATAFLATLPVLAFAMVVQKHLVRIMTMGAVVE